ncbi:MAG: carbohydrate ABC transporter permease [Chloroflexota bacterium]|nr:carbohydrate ABC transporter permease [Chloroflexota bacterium]
MPLLWMVSGAFKGPAEVYAPGLIPRQPTLDNFRYVFTEAPLLRWMGNSLFVSATVTIVGLFFHSMSGYALARLRFPGRELIFFGIFATFLVSLPVILVPLFILVRELGMINQYSGLIVPSIFHAFGIFLLRQFYLGIPRELEEAALVDGAGYWRIYWQIILPLSRPILAALSVFFFLANWNSFLWPLVTTTDRDLYVVQVGIATFRQQYASSQNYILAASTIVALPTVLLFFVFQRQLIESIKTSGFK